MLIQRARLLDGRGADIRVTSHIEEVADTLTPWLAETVLDAAGGTVIPGLHDHHVHLRAAAAALDSVQVGPAKVHSREELSQALAQAPVGVDGWIRAVGYHETAAGPLDRATLDELFDSAPVRIQHRSGVLWFLNSAGLAAVGLPDHPDGRLRSYDSWSDAVARRDTNLATISKRLLGYGVTGVTDATPALGADDIVTLTEEHRHGGLHQGVHWLAPGKRILHDDSLDLDELTGWIAERHRVSGAVALHCVTAGQLVVSLAALRAAGAHPGDRIEHAAVVPADSLAELADIGVLVVTQPNFVAERGDQYLADVEPADQPALWRLASLLDAGVRVALSTDLPFGGADPWAAMRAATRRTAPSGAVLNADECVSATTALTMFTGHAERPDVPRTVEPGQPGDLCVLGAPPADVLDALDAELVTATIVGGHPHVRN
ncbi:putative amidohydrolase YtcJ [Mycolicibacterium sp. BK556]|uniref:amidohydrolase family protein n=1 Tax=unclassified Mycolicibacterium TaxID=2636767 RepID=UPI0016120C82|nr:MULTISPECIES: amidohydrolase family protein [unclassified Mycolicibacterium]MBB3600748.1 putative amidohydrolase YtcJ [Mycolicibacterium sp. BK556]MBB3630502.1 putative amidohydrolase YtcJ [Mycolicibacterium sp. BK607]